MKPLSMQVILITGATDGLGRAVATELAHKGATLLLHGRNKEKGQRALEEIYQCTGNDKLHYYQADFARLLDVHYVAEQVRADYTQLDVLVNNAGMGIEPQRHLSHDGYELTFQVNYLAPFLLTHLLKPLIIQSAPARIVNITSAGQAPIDFNDVMLEHHYEGPQAYCQTKLAEIMFTFDLATELYHHGVTVNCLHPATCMPTKIVVGRLAVLSSIQEGVHSTMHLITAPELDNITGRYFFMEQEAQAEAQAYDEHMRVRLHTLTQQITSSANLSP